ncbi:hypothetical protein [Spiroplasma apis]|uniref:Uncharacterized protein n=1 Tax=Spiroplasma apis B31 TaxID=1276258 RepID=V5RJ45_SPIAP|nr:hypothetical protein [Spiroplasma apis]AHB36121.1 hypothetical protein SAPIS_v1c02750 [Spiroplasma apis B31]
MNCSVCKIIITAEDKFLVDNIEGEIANYHTQCYIEKFGDIKQIEMLEYKKNIKKDKLNRFSAFNVLFLFMLVISIIVMAAYIIYSLVR